MKRICSLFWSPKPQNKRLIKVILKEDTLESFENKEREYNEHFKPILEKYSINYPSSEEYDFFGRVRKLEKRKDDIKQAIERTKEAETLKAKEVSSLQDISCNTGDKNYKIAQELGTIPILEIKVMGGSHECSADAPPLLDHK